jgi:hypothetical protein
MRIKIFTRSIILFLIATMVINSSTPIILCFGESDHLQLEFLKNPLGGTITNPLSCEQTQSDKIYCTESLNSECKDCIDIPILFNFLTIKKHTNPNLNLSNEYTSISIPLNLLVNRVKIISKFKNKNKKSASGFNTILSKISLLI